MFYELCHLNMGWISSMLIPLDLSAQLFQKCSTFLADEFSNFGRKNMHTSTRPCWRGRDYAQYMWDWHPTQVVSNRPAERCSGSMRMHELYMYFIFTVRTACCYNTQPPVLIIHTCDVLSWIHCCWLRAKLACTCWVCLTYRCYWKTLLTISVYAQNGTFLRQVMERTHAMPSVEQSSD